MASVEKKGRKYLVRWRDPDGSQRTRTCPDADTARRLRLEVERSTALGIRWEPADAHALPVLLEVDAEGEPAGMFADYLHARRARLADGTQRHYDRALRRFAVWLEGRAPRRRRLTVDLLTRDTVEAWFGDLVRDDGDDLGISTARLYVSAVMSAWEWGYDSDTYGDVVPRPRKPDLPVAPSTPAAAPTWAQMDAAIASAWRLASTCRTSLEREGWTWRARLCTLLRFTGLRVDEQAMRLRWDDVDLAAGRLLIRGELGKSRQERAGRELPLSPHLVEHMAGWGTREGWILAPHVTLRHSRPTHMAEIWQGSGVPERVWGVGPGRSKTQVHHAFRKGFKTGLSALGVTQEVRDYLVGHHRGIDEHYLDTAEQAREAVGRIPPLAESNVIRLRAGDSD
jgi:site-specific recombinase XerD